MVLERATVHYQPIVDLNTGAIAGFEALLRMVDADGKAASIGPVIEQIEKQLRKLINIIKLRDMTGPKAVKREMALICVNARAEHRAEILRIVDIFRCKVVDIGSEHFIIEVTGDEAKLEANQTGEPAASSACGGNIPLRPLQRPL